MSLPEILMEEFSRGRPDGKPSDPGEGGAALRTPSKGDSSSPGHCSALGFANPDRYSRTEHTRPFL